MIWSKGVARFSPCIQGNKTRAPRTGAISSAAIMVTLFGHSLPTGGLLMSLIFSCVTERFVIQIGDRRMTLRNDSAPDEYHDHVNKQVVFRNQMVFGCTGLGWILNMPTDVWLARYLSDHSFAPLTDALNGICALLNNAFEHVTFDAEKKRLVIVGVGFDRPSPESDWTPCTYIISNAHTPQGFLGATAANEFVLRTGFRKPRTQDHVFMGAELDPEVRKKADRQLKETALLDDRSNYSQRLITVGSQAIREVAKRNKSVGRDLLMVGIPKEAVGLDWTVIGDPDWGIVCGPDPDREYPLEPRIETAYLRFGDDSRREYIPNFAGYGRAIVHGTRTTTPGSG